MNNKSKKAKNQAGDDQKDQPTNTAKIDAGLPAEATKLLAGWQRCQADFDNFRKRTEQEKANWQESAKTDLILDLLPVVDNFELALAHLSDKQKQDPSIQGILHIQNQLNDIMARIGVVKIDAKPGDKFDENLHEAVESATGKGGVTIEKILKQGYRVGEKVLRPTKVTVY